MFRIWESNWEYLILKCCFLFYSCQIAISLARVCLSVIECVCVFYASFQSLLKHLVLNFSYDTFNRSFNFLLLLLGCWLLLHRSWLRCLWIVSMGLNCCLRVTAAAAVVVIIIFIMYRLVIGIAIYFFSWLVHGSAALLLPCLLSRASELSDHDHNIFFWFTQHQCC